jgi:hypothetical protein
VIAFAPEDRVIIEDEHALYTGTVIGMFLLVRGERAPDETGYAVALDGDDGPVLLATAASLWPEHPTPVPTEPIEQDGVHDWSRP